MKQLLCFIMFFFSVVTYAMEQSLIPLTLQSTIVQSDGTKVYCKYDPDSTSIHFVFDPQKGKPKVKAPLAKIFKSPFSIKNVLIRGLCKLGTSLVTLYTVSSQDSVHYIILTKYREKEPISVPCPVIHGTPGEIKLAHDQFNNVIVSVDIKDPQETGLITYNYTVSNDFLKFVRGAELVSQYSKVQTQNY